MRYVLVHGRGQEGKNPGLLQAEWMTALEQGLQASGTSMPSSVQFRMPYYGDCLDAALQAIDAPLTAEIRLRGDSIDGYNPTFRREVLEEIARARGITLAEVQQEMASNVLTRGPLNWEWVQALLRRLDKSKLASSVALDAFTRDVYAYLTYPSVRSSVDAVVMQALSEDPCIMVSHSLGTVVAYNVLRRAETMQQRLHVANLVTLGSPLGVKAIKRRLDAPLTRPRCVRRWFNAYDDRDVVSLYPLTRQHFGVTPDVERNKSDVRNPTDNHHGISGYLANGEVALECIGLQGGTPLRR